jgi:DNA-binding NarL/FixJ family response regulator
VRVVIADDVMLVRSGLARLLADAGVQVVGEAEDAGASAAMFRKLGLEPSADVNRRVLAVLTALRG